MKVAERISKLAFDKYEKRLEKSFIKAARAEAIQALALYFEYDLDNNWSSNFYVCDLYNSEEDDDDWAADWYDDEVIEGPSFAATQAVYQSGFDDTPKALGTTLYMVARTVAAFGRCFDKHATPGPAICIAFHDQTPIMRLSEPSENRKPLPRKPVKVRPRQELDEVAMYVMRHYLNIMSAEDRAAISGFCVPDELPDQYMQCIIDKLIAERPGEVFINRCPKCQSLCRTPQATQCPQCVHRWSS